MKRSFRWWLTVAALVLVVGPWAGDAVRVVRELVSSSWGNAPGWWLP